MMFEYVEAYIAVCC